jgi:hypothetical protein
MAEEELFARFQLDQLILPFLYITGYIYITPALTRSQKTSKNKVFGMSLNMALINSNVTNIE